MRFDEYVRRDYIKPRSKAMDFAKAKFTIENDCKEILKVYRNSESRIYRGTNKNIGIFFINPKSNRMSQNTINFYTILVDNLPSWSKYPKRGQGIVSANNYNTANGYGNVYMAFPLDGAKIGVCPRSDIWNSFNSLLNDDLDQFNHDLASVMTMELDLKTKLQLIKALESMEKKMKIDPLKLNTFNRLFQQAKYDGEKPLLQFFDDVFDPEENGFKLFDTSNYKPIYTSNEVWFDSPAVMISNETLLSELGVNWV